MPALHLLVINDCITLLFLGHFIITAAVETATWREQNIAMPFVGAEVWYRDLNLKVGLYKCTIWHCCGMLQFLIPAFQCDADCAFISSNVVIVPLFFFFLHLIALMNRMLTTVHFTGSFVLSCAHTLNAYTVFFVSASRLTSFTCTNGKFNKVWDNLVCICMWSPVFSLSFFLSVAVTVFFLQLLFNLLLWLQPVATCEEWLEHALE